MQPLGHFCGAHPIDGNVVNLGHDREGARGQEVHVIQALDHVHLPDGSSHVQWAGMQPGKLDAELPPVARLGQGDVANMEFKVEVGIVDPVGIVKVQRNLHETLPEYW